MEAYSAWVSNPAGNNVGFVHPAADKPAKLTLPSPEPGVWEIMPVTRADDSRNYPAETPAAWLEPVNYHLSVSVNAV